VRRLEIGVAHKSPSWLGGGGGGPAVAHRVALPGTVLVCRAMPRSRARSRKSLILRPSLPSHCPSPQRLAASQQPQQQAAAQQQAEQQQQSFVSDEERRTLSASQLEFLERRRGGGAGLGPLFPES